MNINFGMWRTAIWTLVKMDSKDEWDKLDVVSKWLIATRSGVTLVTVYTCVIAGLLAARDGYFSFSWLLSLGLFLYGTNNLLNDHTDLKQVDSDNYFHARKPSAAGFWTKPQQPVGFWQRLPLRKAFLPFHTEFETCLLLYTIPKILSRAATFHWGLSCVRVYRPAVWNCTDNIRCCPGRVLCLSGKHNVENTS
jgi:hypothetical protein